MLLHFMLVVLGQALPRGILRIRCAVADAH